MLLNGILFKIISSNYSKPHVYNIFTTLFTAVDFLHKNFSSFLRKPEFLSPTYHGSSSSTFYDDHTSSKSFTSILENESNESPTQELTKLLLKLLKVNGTPLIDVSLDLSPRNSSIFIGVIRVPQRQALLPRLVRPGKGLAFINRWVSIIQIRINLGRDSLILGIAYCKLSSSYTKNKPKLWFYTLSNKPCSNCVCGWVSLRKWKNSTIIITHWSCQTNFPVQQITSMASLAQEHLQSNNFMLGPLK